jgi:hypothetical protein
LRPLKVINQVFWHRLNELNILEGIYIKENGFLFLNVIILNFISKFFGWVHQNQNSDLVYGFLLGFCIDHKYLNMLDWLYFEENTFFISKTIFKEFLKKYPFGNTFAPLIVSTVLRLENYFFFCAVQVLIIDNPLKFR